MHAQSLVQVADALHKRTASGANIRNAYTLALPKPAQTQPGSTRDRSRSLSARLPLLARRDCSGRSLRVAASCPAAAFAASFESRAAVGSAPLSFGFLARLLLAEGAAALAAAAVSPAPIRAVLPPPLAFVDPLGSVSVLALTLTLTSPFAWDVSEQGLPLLPPPASPPSPTPPLPAELLERFRLLDGYRRSELSLQAGHNHCVWGGDQWRHQVQQRGRRGAKFRGSGAQ